MYVVTLRKLLIFYHPTITETRIVPELSELPFAVAKLLSDALDEGPDIRPIAFLTLAGGETLAMHQIVDLAIADVPAGVDGQVLDDRELRESKGRFLALPEGAIAVRPQLQIPEMAAGHAGHCTGGTFRIDGKLNALEDAGEAAGLVHEIDGTAVEGGFLVDLVVDRKSAVEGKGVSVGVDLGERRSSKKKKH